MITFTTGITTASNTHHFTSWLSSSRPGVLTSTRAKSAPPNLFGDPKGKKIDVWANFCVCNNCHFAIAHPLHPLHPWGWGLQGVSFSLHPWRGGSHAFKTTKLLKVITFDHFHNRNPYSYEHSSFYTLPFIQSPWGADQPQSQLAPLQAQALLGEGGGLRENS